MKKFNALNIRTTSSNTGHFLMFLFFMSLILNSCKKENSSPVDNTTPLVTEKGTPTGDALATSIGTSGGIVVSADGNLTVTIPSGALSSTTSVSIQPISCEAPLSFGSGYRLLPEGTTFNKPVTISFHYTGLFLQETPEDFLWIVTQAEDGTWNAMLKSVVDKNTKIVTVETTHFSDWALGKFVDFKLTPASSTILKGQSVELHIVGFSRDKAYDNDVLAPLPAPSDLGDGLTPLAPIPPVESRLMSFRVKQWTLNGAAAPVSNANGSLRASGSSATYTAPNKKPTVNPVAVSVQLEANNKEGGKASYIVTSAISVVDTDLYLLLKVDGTAHEYYQYGFDGSIPPDPNNVATANCTVTEGKLSMVGLVVTNNSDIQNAFGLVFNNPSVTTRSLIGFYNGGEDDVDFKPSLLKEYRFNYTHRAVTRPDYCETVDTNADFSLTILTYEDAYNGVFKEITGYFSGTLYEDQEGYGLQCKMPDKHQIEGEFRLLVVEE